MFVIALTGGIGSGKTTVSELFKSKNISIIDTDVIAREIVNQDQPAYAEIIKLFGKDILDDRKNINRQILRKRIFSSEKKRQQLEEVLHPIIWQQVKHQLQSLSSPQPYAIVVVPLLFENLTKNKPVKFDRILVIDTDEEHQIKRSLSRDSCDESTIKNIIKSQVSRKTRNKGASDIILNNEGFDDLENQVNLLHESYLKLSS